MKLFSRKKAKTTIKDKFVNYVSGAGSAQDKGQAGFFQPSNIANNNVELERLYVESWAAAKIIDIPVEDMFTEPRQISNLSDSDKKKLETFEANIELTEKIKNLIKAAHVFGTAFMLMILDDNIMTLPIDFNSKFLNLKNIIIVDRFRTTILEFDRDITSPNFNKPLLYQITIDNIAPIIVHYSRVHRVDSISPLSTNNWQSGYNKQWGISKLVRIFNTVSQEESFASATSYLANESSIPILKIPDLQDALAGAPDALGGTPEDAVPRIDALVDKINGLKSIYRTTYLDSEMELTRLEASFANFDKIFDKFHVRLAAAADIPRIRFFGQSPSGLNKATDGEMDAYNLKIMSYKQTVIRAIYEKIDKLSIKTLGISDAVVFTFGSLLDLGEKDKSDIEYQNAKTDQIYMANGVISEEEVRLKLFDNKIYDITADNTPAAIDADVAADMQKNIVNARENENAG